jgi:hypothetical protein
MELPTIIMKQAKSDLENIASQILKGIDSPVSDNAIEELKNRLQILQSFLEAFPDKAAEKSNEIMKEYEEKIGEEKTTKLREKLIELSQTIIFETRDKILNN